MNDCHFAIPIIRDLPYRQEAIGGAKVAGVRETILMVVSCYLWLLCFVSNEPGKDEPLPSEKKKESSGPRQRHGRLVLSSQ